VKRLFVCRFTDSADKNVAEDYIIEICKQYSSPDIIRQVKARRMRWAGMWHAWERRKKCTKFWWKERDHLKDQGVDGKMGSEWGGVDWIRLAQDRDRWRAVVSAVMNLRVFAPRS
jgi:uncharacterized membrane-anchored protein